MQYYFLNILVQYILGKPVKNLDAEILVLGDLSQEDSKVFWDSLNGDASLFHSIHEICRGNISNMTLLQNLLQKNSSLELAIQELFGNPVFASFSSIIHGALRETDIESSKANSNYLQMEVLHRILNSDGYSLPKDSLMNSPELLETANKMVQNNNLSVYLARPLGRNKLLNYPAFTFTSPVIGYYVQTQRKKNFKTVTNEQIQQTKQQIQQIEKQTKQQIEQQKLKNMKRLFIQDYSKKENY